MTNFSPEGDDSEFTGDNRTQLNKIIGWLFGDAPADALRAIRNENIDGKLHGEQVIRISRQYGLAAVLRALLDTEK